MASQHGLQTSTIYMFSQYFLKLRQPDNEIWSSNRMQQEKCFSSKIIQKIKQRRVVPDLFLLLETASYEVKAKQNVCKLYSWSRNVLNFLRFRKRFWSIFPRHFGYDFSGKFFFKLYSINWPNFIAQYVLCNFLGHKFWN